MGETPPIGWVLYDDSCGFCRRWVPFWRETLRKRGFAIAPLQAEWARQRLDAADGDLLDDLRLLTADGAQVRGADVYRYVMRRIWWAYPFYLLSTAPWLRRVFDWSYRSFAANRYRFSRACRLPADE
jgi:predicted DCC family thiol-disulfide oxidoreductase YuxK